MNLRAVLIGLLLLIAPAAHAQTPDKAALAEVDRIFDEWRLAAHAPGVVYGVVTDGRLVHVRGLGVQDVQSNTPLSADSLFRIASMSKAFTALALLKLRDEGKVSLDAPAETYAPELKAWRYPTSDSPKITVRNLLTHTAGFVEDNPWGDRQQAMSEADFTWLLQDGVSFAQPPGLRMEYSNLGYAILGRIVSNVSGRRYQDYIGTEIMTPLGMGSTGYDVFASPQGRRAIGYRWESEQWVREPDMTDGAFGAMGGIETSANDYARWVAFLLSAWPARDGAEQGPVRRGTVREIVTGNNFARGQMRDAVAGGTPCRQAVAYAMGWNAVDDCDLGLVVGHTGGYPGYGSAVILLPEKGGGIFAFSSVTYADASVAVMRAAMTLQKAGALPARPAPVSSGLAAAYDAVKAVWRSGDITAAPLANNMLMDRDESAWKAEIGALNRELGACAGSEAITPLSAMEGWFVWTCERGGLVGRVLRAPTPEMTIQALEFFPSSR